ncbi:glycosyltransferase (plasmid) [Rhizobium sp. CB3171]|uniref:glycosyltransferase n=1 Tax=Rhizobium sp. CB3171 TaxID=3039157 RepID=UPI0024B25E09|nr:glycosyltransferase [Rhizobium sp. CB3171]WFU05949.1 glycosyltransferase [Rhizobium sp. CB3171]
MELPTLRKIFDDHEGLGSDKWTSYFKAYESHLQRYRSQSISLLEIGVQNGGSLEIWSKFFPKAERVLGCDIDPKCALLKFDDPRISVLVGHVNAPETLAAITQDTANFDIIIDDGSHVVEDVIKTFALYFPLLKSGGTFVIEDLHTSYWPSFGGGSDLNLSSMGFLKLLSDLANKEFWRSENEDFNFLDAYAKRYGVSIDDRDIAIEEISFSNSVCIIRKGDGNFENRRHMTGTKFHVHDYSEAKKLSGTRELVNLLDVQIRLPQATEMQREFVDAIPFVLSNKSELGRLRQQFDEATVENEHLRNELGSSRNELGSLRNELGSLRNELGSLQNELGSLRGHIARLHSSRSWRATRPFRILARVVRSGKYAFEFANYLYREQNSLDGVGPRLGQTFRERGIKGVTKSLAESYFAMRIGRPIDRWPPYSEQEIPAQISLDENGPLISVIIPIYNTPERLLLDAVNSVRNQTYQNWQLCLVDDNSDSRPMRKILKRIAKKDRRIEVYRRKTNGHISAACNDGLAMSRGNYVTILDHDDVLHKSALALIAQAIVQQPGVDYIYSDEDKLSSDGQLVHSPFFKPDWSPEYMLSMMYTCHMSVFRKGAIESVGGFRSDFDGAQDYDLALRVTGLGGKVHHVPHCLYHWRIWERSTAHSPDAKPYALNNAKRALAEHLSKQSDSFELVDSPFPGHTKVNFLPKGEPLVSIVIPTANGSIEVDGKTERHIDGVVESILTKSTYKNIEIVIVHNGDLSTEQSKHLESLAHVKLVRYTSSEKFNLADKINLGGASAAGEFILILNDDIRVIAPEWLDRMVAMAQRDGVGVVGAKLLFPDDRIQHAGVVMLGGLPGHPFYEAPGSSQGYGLSIQVDRNYIAVTGACHMTPKWAFDKLGGYNPRYALNYNDVDYCLRVRDELGLRSVYVADAELYHYEGVSKEGGRSVAEHEIQMFIDEWAAKYPRDPYYNPNLNQNVPYS